jgi:hypothetical protein
MPRSTLAFRKALGYFVTDAGNFIGHISRKTLEVTGKGKTDPMERRPWMNKILKDNAVYTAEQVFDEFREAVFPTWISDEDTLFCEERDNWFIDPCFKYFCNQLDMEIHVVHEWYMQIRYATSIDEFVTLHKADVEVPGFAATVDGALVGPPMQTANVPPQVNPRDEVICKFHFLKNKKCKRGRACKFSHNLDGVCRNHLRGKCTRGARCKFRHLVLSAAI